MRFLITGASGFIGYQLAIYLGEKYGKYNIQVIVPNFNQNYKEKERHDNLINSNFDIIEHDILKDDLDLNKIKEFDVLYHLAAFTETETKSPRVHTNDVGTERLIRALGSKLKEKRVVYTGSLASVDRKRLDNTPQDENYPCNPRTIYGQTKLRAENIICDYAQKFGFEWTILRLCTVYGKGYRQGGMFTMLKNGLEKNSITTKLMWPGRISLVYVKDVILVLDALSVGEIGRNSLYHISSGEDPVFDNLISQIASVINIRRKIINLPKIFWSYVNYVIWLPGLMSIVPFWLTTIIWRLSLITSDGMVANAAKLNKVLPIKYTPLPEGLIATYKE